MLKNYKERIAHTADILISDNLRYDLLQAGLNDLLNLFAELVDTDFESEEERGDIHLDHGIAIASRWTLNCVIDIRRTRSFVKGVYHAVQEKLKEGNDPVKILYAGSGPFATLVMPLTQIFSPAQLQVSIIEVNPQSLSALKQLITQLNLSDYFAELIQADATQYQIPIGKSYDILLSETMQKALLRELQVPITLNLLNQLPAEVILIPEQIQLSLGYFGPTIGPIEERVTLIDHFYSLDKSTKHPTQENGHLAYPKQQFSLLASYPKNQSWLAIFTRIKTYGEEVIDYFESGLTIPYILVDLFNNNRPPKSICLQYRIEEEPFIWSELAY